MNLDKYNPERKSKKDDIEKAQALGRIDSLVDLEKMMENQSTTNSKERQKPALKKNTKEDSKTIKTVTKKTRAEENADIVAEMQLLKPKIENFKLKKEENLEELLERSENYLFLNETFINNKNEEEKVVNPDWIKNDYTKSIFFLYKYLSKDEIANIIERDGTETYLDIMEREFYTFSDAEINNGLGEVKIKTNISGKEGEISIKELITEGNKRISKTILNEKHTHRYMTENNLKTESAKVGKILYHNFPIIKLKNKKEIKNTIPWDMSFVVAKGYFDNDSFASFNPETGEISLVSTKDIVDNIWQEIIKFVPDFPKPEGTKLLTPKDPKILKQGREKITEEVWIGILGIKKEKKNNRKQMDQNTDPNIIEPTTQPPVLTPEPEPVVVTSAEEPIKTQEDKLKKIEEIKQKEIELAEKIKTTEKNLQKLFAEVEKLKKEDAEKIKKDKKEYSSKENLEKKSYPTELIKQQIEGFLNEIKEIKKINKLEIKGEGEEIKINIELKASKFMVSSNVNLKAVISNNKENISIKSYEINASKFEDIIKSMITPKI
nr:hypothetical protein [bacterium]